MTMRNRRLVRVDGIERVARNIKQFHLVPIDGEPLPVFSAGAHVVVTMKEGDTTRRNPYSLMSSPLDRSRYSISVLKVADSRGGSQFMHDNVKIGTTLEIGDPVNLFPIAHTARKHIMIAGGIGITPFMAMLAKLRSQNADFELHYAVRSPEDGAFFGMFENERLPGVHLYCSAKGQRINLGEILRYQRVGTHLYVCGPQRMIDWAIETAREEGWPDENVHNEHFSAPSPGHPFIVKLAKTGREIQVGEHQSILEALEQAGIDAPYLCRGGACGQCIVRVSDHEGTVYHNDHYLSDKEKKQCDQIATCVSRTDGSSLTLDL